MLNWLNAYASNRQVKRKDAVDIASMTNDSPITAETMENIVFSKIFPALIGAATAILLVMPLGWLLGGGAAAMGILMGGIVALTNLTLIGLVSTWSVSFAKGNIASFAVGVGFLKLPILLFSVWLVATNFDAYGVIVSFIACLLGASIAVYKNNLSLKTV